MHSCRLRIPKESGLAPRNQSHRVGFQERFEVPVPGHLQGHLPARPPHSPCSEQRAPQWPHRGQPTVPSAVWAVRPGPASLPWVWLRALSQQAWQEVARTIQKARVCFGGLADCLGSHRAPGGRGKKNKQTTVGGILRFISHYCSAPKQAGQG